MKREDIGYLCAECADGLGWRWPEGHCATMHTGKCGVCGEEKSLSCWNDWLVPGEDRMAPHNWD
jgi:hypothetical protein